MPVDFLNRRRIHKRVRIIVCRSNVGENKKIVEPDQRAPLTIGVVTVGGSGGGGGGGEMYICVRRVAALYRNKND